ILLSLLLVSAGEDVPTDGGAVPAARPTVAAPSFATLVAALPYVAQGDRYEVRSDVSPEAAAECLAVLEAAWPAFVERFGVVAVPRAGTRLPVHVYRTRDVYREHLVAGMEPWNPPAAGFYDRVHGVGHLEWSPRAYSTRRLLLHEAAHQFHYLALG